MKKIIFSTLMLLPVMVTLAHAGNTAISNQSGSYGTNVSISQIGDANVVETNQYAGNAFAEDSLIINQMGHGNKSYSIQIASNVDNDKVGNRDRIIQTGNDNIAYTVSIGDDNQTIITQNTKENFAEAYISGYNNTTNIRQNAKENIANTHTEGYGNTINITQNTKDNIAGAYTIGYNNDTRINQFGNALYGSNQAYSTIIDSFDNNVIINQGQISRTAPVILTTSENYASSYINHSQNNDVTIAQNGHDNSSAVYVDNSSSNDISTTQTGYGNVVAVSAEYASDVNDIAINQNGSDNNAYVAINNGYYNDVAIIQNNTGHYATASVIGANNGSVTIIQN